LDKFGGGGGQWPPRIQAARFFRLVANPFVANAASVITQRPGQADPSNGQHGCPIWSNHDRNAATIQEADRGRYSFFSRRGATR